MRSIERHLMLWILATAAVGAALLGGVAYRVILADLNDTLDENLLAVAMALADHGPRRSADTPSAAEHSGTEGAEIVVVEWTPQGSLAFTSNAQVSLHFTDRPGLARQRVNGTDWDAYTVVRPGGVVQAAQRANYQQHEAAEAAAQLLSPFALVFGAMAALLMLALRRGLAPLDRTAADVAARSAISLEPIDTAHLPREVAPLVLALNALMQRLSASLSARQRFVADAAHELRTPITALKLQLQLLRGAPDGIARRRAHDELQASVERVQRLVEQLLELSRSEPGATPGPRARVSLAALVQSAVGRFSPQAEHLGIDLGARVQAAGLVLGDEEALRVLLDNLIGNALRFTPRGGVVDVEVTDADGCAMLRVIDDGPGIAAEEREQVFERFHRARGSLPAHADESGSGLGLAIVKAVADGHGALVTLHDGRKGHGLEVRVVFPPHGGEA